jgi:hypothetical protein
MRRRLASICRAFSLLAAATALAGCQSGITAAHRMIEGQAIERTLDYPAAPFNQRFDMPVEPLSPAKSPAANLSE